MDNINDNRFYNKHPGIFLVLLSVITYLMLDFLLGAIFIPDNPNQFRTYHPYYHHDLKPNVCVQTTWDAVNYYQMCTNSLGFRDEKIRTIDLKTDKTRFLIIGDSHTEGVGLEFKDTFTGQLIRMTDSAHYEFLNAGVVSYSPKLYYLKTKFLIEQVKLEFDHLIVFIDISDIQNELAYENFNPGKKIGLNIRLHNLNTFFKDHSLTWYAVQLYREKQKLRAFYKNANREVKNPKTDLYSTFFSDFNNSEFLRDKAFHDIGSWYLNRKIFEKWGRKGLTLESEYMQKLVLLCRKNNIKISISIHPWPVQIKYGDVNSIQVQFWSKFAKFHKIGLINLFPVFFGLNQKFDVIKECYQKGDVHWNAKGSKIVAETVLRYLEESYPDIQAH
ncbi:MAG: hypothetical protein GXO86_04745 [Chlorobi bacterium]|nr:hypothetical protein [Chlorobiota bacterium]